MPTLLVSSIGTLQCILDEQLQHTKDRVQQSQLAEMVIDLIRLIVPHASLSPALLLTKKLMLFIAKQGTMAALIEKATSCLVTIVSFWILS